MRLRLPALLLAAGLASACDSPASLAESAPVAADGVLLMADDDTYRPGDAAHLTLANGAADTVTTGVLECAVLEHWSGAAWALAPDGNDRACILLAVAVAPGDVHTGSVPLDVPAGVYRAAQDVAVGDRPMRVATAAFRVE